MNTHSRLLPLLSVGPDSVVAGFSRSAKAWWPTPSGYFQSRNTQQRSRQISVRVRGWRGVFWNSATRLDLTGHDKTGFDSTRLDRTCLDWIWSDRTRREVFIIQ
jgi:hypothetical protein